MFTGIIEDIGVLEKIDDSRCVVATKLKDIKIGDSISVNGICLTVSVFSPLTPISRLLTFDISEETLNRTALKNLKKGDMINLERAMKYDGRFGGHIVSGHVDTTGRIESVKKHGNSVLVSIKSPLEHIIEKGSVAIDGISLTVTSLDENNSTFDVSAIPHTMACTNLKHARAGRIVNIEFDILAKYIEKFSVKKEFKKITKEFLKNAGFI